MPTYDYECMECRHSFDAFQSMMDDPLTECPVCGRHSLKRLIGGGIGVIFKGSGFYVNDSRKGGSTATKSKTEKKSADTTSGSESSSAGKTEKGSSSGSGNSSGTDKKSA